MGLHMVRLFRSAYGPLIAGFAMVIALAPGVSPSAKAASPAQWARCETFDDAGLAACTRIIQSKQESVEERAKALAKRAWHYHYKADHARARADFEAAISLAPQRVETYDSFAWMLKDDLPEQAVEPLTRAIELQDSVYRRQQRAEIHRRLNRELLAIEDYKVALALANAEIEKGPKYAYVFKQRSDVQRELGAIPAALADFEEYLKRKSPSDAAYLDDRVNLQVQKGDFEKALADLGEVKGDFDKQLKRALILRAKGDFHASIREYERMLTEYLDPEMFMGRGLAYAGLGRFNRAIVDFTKAIDQYPESSAAHYNRAQATRLDGHPQVALADYNIAIELEPRNPAFYNSRGRAYLELKDPARALADFSKAIEVDQRFAAAYANRGQFHQAAGKVPLAIEDFTKAITANPDEHQFLAARAQALIQIGDIKGAERDYALALRFAPTDAHLYLGSATVRAKLGKLNEAFNDLNRGLILDANLAAGYALRADLHARLKDSTKADADRKLAAEAAARAKSVRPTLDYVRVVIRGKFPRIPGFLDPFKMDATIELRGDQITYQEPNLKAYRLQSGENLEEKFFGLCSGQTTTNEGQRMVTASIDKDLVHVQLRSRLDFATGACRGRHNYFNATYLVDLHNGTCKFDYRQVRDLFGVGEFSDQVADQICRIEPLPR